MSGCGNGREEAGEPCETEEVFEHKLQKRRRIASDQRAPYSFREISGMVFCRLFIGEPLTLGDGTALTTHHGWGTIPQRVETDTERAATKGTTRDGNDEAELVGQGGGSCGERNADSSGERERESAVGLGRKTICGSP